jgi:aminoglycoside phosphotransferase (APT) family kinase protein
MLQATGFHNVQCYWSWPPPDRLPLFWAPLDARGAWRYLLASRPPDRRRLRQWVRWLARTMAYGLHEMGLLSPVCAVAYKPEAEQQVLATGSMTHWLLALWRDRRLGSLPQNLSLLFLTGGTRSTNKIVALVFAETEAQPRLVIKLPRVPDSVRGLQREAMVLEAVHTRRAAPPPGVPQIVFCDEGTTHFLLGETALDGVPLFTRLNRRNYHEWASRVTDWLIQLAGVPLPVSREVWWARLIEPVLDDIQRSLGSVVEVDMLDETTAALAQIEALPLVCEQRDFSPWNVLITASGELAVLDWESAELDGLPGLDLIYCLTYLAFFVEDAMKSGKFAEVYRRCWSGQTAVGRANVECLQRYYEALNLDAALGPTLRLFTWLLHTRSEYARLTADAGSTPTRETLRQSLFVRLWKEEYNTQVGDRRVT